MQNPVEFIQKSILRDPSPTLTPRLTAFFEEIQRELFDFHDWKFAIRYTTLSLTDENRYEVSGADDDLIKLLAMRYGTNYEKMNPCGNMERFYDEYYNQTNQTTPLVWVPESKLEDTKWRVFIYPTSGSGLEDITYWYKRQMRTSDFALFTNQMVLVYGIMWLYFTPLEKYQQAHDYMTAYLNGRKIMKWNDEPMVYPDKRIISSDETKRIRQTVENFQNLRRR